MISADGRTTCEVHIQDLKLQVLQRGRRGRDRMVVGLTTTCAISTYHH